MNKQGQSFGFIKILFIAGFFIVIFALGLSPAVTAMLGASDLSVFGGFGQWAVGNLNLWFLGAFVLVMIAGLIYGLSSE